MSKFALKEAVKKAISCKISSQDIQTSHSDSKPIIKIKKMNRYHFLASISHEKEFAIRIIISVL